LKLLTPFLINIIHEVQWADRAATYYPPEKPISLHGPATAIVRLALIEDRRLFITYLDEFWEEEDVGMINIINTARLGGKKVKYCIPQDPGQASKGQVKKYSLQMPGYNFEGIIESGSKEDPAEAPGNWAKVNKFYIWDKAATPELIKRFKKVCAEFPGHRHKDFVDALSGPKDLLFIWFMLQRMLVIMIKEE